MNRKAVIRAKRKIFEGRYFFLFREIRVNSIRWSLSVKGLETKVSGRIVTVHRFARLVRNLQRSFPLPAYSFQIEQTRVYTKFTFSAQTMILE